MHPAVALSVLFFLRLAAAVSNLQVSTQNPTSGGTVTITWSGDSTDPSAFSLEMVNTNFHNTFAISNNVQTSSGTITLQLPAVPPDTYTIEAVQINNVNDVIGQSGSFAVGAPVSTTSSGSMSSTQSTSGSVSSASASATGSKSTPSGSSASSSSSSSNSAPSASASSFNGNGNGALGTHINSGSVGSIAAAVVGIVAGAVFV